MNLLKEFASTACRTSNPDLIWQIAYVESGFQFEMVRINGVNAREYKVLKNQAAVNYLKNLKKSQDKVNVDIGVMQMNWAAHRHEYENDPTEMLKPKRQVSYLLDGMITPLVKKCGGNWVGCYHQWINGDSAYQYRKRVEKAGKKLKKYSLKVYKSKFNESKQDDKKIKTSSPILDELVIDTLDN